MLLQENNQCCGGVMRPNAKQITVNTPKVDYFPITVSSIVVHLIPRQTASDCHFWFINERRVMIVNNLYTSYNSKCYGLFGS